MVGTKSGNRVHRGCEGISKVGDLWPEGHGAATWGRGSASKEWQGFTSRRGPSSTTSPMVSTGQQIAFVERSE